MAVPYRLIVAEDMDVLRQAIRKLLDGQPGVTVVGEACDYGELLELLDQSHPDVIVMDVRMPNQSEITPETIKSRLRGACLIAISIWTDEETAKLAQRYGAFRLLDKMQLHGSLLPTIEECFRDRESPKHAST
jgi:DNA-binding NarL/FixJ family response regulator